MQIFKSKRRSLACGLSGLAALMLGLGAWGLVWSQSPPWAAQGRPWLESFELIGADGFFSEDQPIEQLLGIRAAERRLGEAAPTGRGIAIGHVEGEPDSYRPDTGASFFDGVEFLPRTGEAGSTAHATTTGRILYGRDGLAPGVQRVHLYSTPGWLVDAYLRAGTPYDPRDDEPRVFSHSWIAPENPRHTQVLRRVDYAVDTHDVIMCVGVNNDRRSRVPALLGSSYNAIAVGSGGGHSSGGYTRTEVDGRTKPDIVGPKGLTSYATPAVAAVAARLLDAADRLAEDAPNAVRAELIKALLLTGAVKPWNWSPEDGKPLDEHLGAGMAHLDRSLRILETGPIPPDQSAYGPMGWDFRSIDRGQAHDYRFEIEQAGELTATLAWHRRISGRRVRSPFSPQWLWLTTPSLAELHLRLYHADAQGQETLVAESASAIDNVQHVHLEAPAGSTYRLEVRRADDQHREAWDYALAWRAGEAQVVEEREE